VGFAKRLRGCDQCFERHGILPNDCSCENECSVKLYIGFWVFWQCVIKAWRKKVNMHVGSWFENNPPCFICTYGLDGGKIQIGYSCGNVAVNFKSYLCYQLICNYLFLASWLILKKMNGGLWDHLAVCVPVHLSVYLLFVFYAVCAVSKEYRWVVLTRTCSSIIMAYLLLWCFFVV
jgi:hypothetical protein